MVLVRYLTVLIIVALTLVSCGNDLSLQRYLVDKQDDDKFLKVDVAASLLQAENGFMTDEQLEILNTIKKVNVVAYPIKNGDVASYETEKTKLTQIVDQEKYKLLSKVKSSSTNITFKYLGDDETIDEVIVLASDKERGFAVFRLLGDNMRPGDMMKLLSTVESGDLDLSKFNGLGDMFKEANTEEL